MYASRLPDKDVVAGLAFQLSHQQDRTNQYNIVTTISSVEEISRHLRRAALNPTPSDYALPRRKRPVVLLFGGQNGPRVAVSHGMYQSCYAFHAHLDDCNKVCLQQGLPSLFPAIFEEGPILDLAYQHCLLFALQYACARTWIDSGIQVAAIVGHSFGQLTALCVDRIGALPL